MNDVVDEVLEDGAIDREEYFKSIMELTKLGFVDSDIETEEDIEMSEAAGFDIRGLTSEGLEYIKLMSKEPGLGDKVNVFCKKFNEICEKVNNNSVVKLTGSLLLPALQVLLQ